MYSLRRRGYPDQLHLLTPPPARKRQCSASFCTVMYCPPRELPSPNAPFVGTCLLAGRDRNGVISVVDLGRDLLHSHHQSISTTLRYYRASPRAKEPVISWNLRHIRTLAVQRLSPSHGLPAIQLRPSSRSLAVDVLPSSDAVPAAARPLCPPSSSSTAAAAAADGTRRRRVSA